MTFRFLYVENEGKSALFQFKCGLQVCICAQRDTKLELIGRNDLGDCEFWLRI